MNSLHLKMRPPDMGKGIEIVDKEISGNMSVLCSPQTEPEIMYF